MPSHRPIDPSAANHQPWKFIFVTDSAVKEKLVDACRGQKFIADAPLIIVGCGYPEESYTKQGAKTGGWASVDVDIAIALDHFSLAAITEGIGTCWIGAFETHLVRGVLGIPEDVRITALMTCGYPDDPTIFAPVPENKRKQLDDIICENRYRD